MTQVLPPRTGPRPRTHKGLPHKQLNQQPRDDTIRAQLAKRLVALEGIAEAPSGISVPGARALVMRDGTTAPPAAFMIGREFAHLHPPPDYSLHITLPAGRAPEVIQAGWAEFHPLVEEGQLPPTVVMVYAPRDETELSVVSSLVRESYQFARGLEPVAGTQTAADGPSRREPIPN